MFKKRLVQCLSLVLCAALLAVPVFAAETAEATSETPETASETPKPSHMAPVPVWGTLTWTESGGLYVKNSSEEGINEIILHGESILCLDAVTGEPMDIQDLKDGDTVYAWVGPAMTMSLPPQATAQLILGNIPADYAVPQYYEIYNVTPQVQAAIYPPPPMTWTEVTATDGTTLKITDEAELALYQSEDEVRLEDLIPGTRVLVWSDAQGQPEKVLVFPYAYQGYLTVAEDTVSVNGGVVSKDIKTTEDGDTLLPIRAVAEALGLEVAWNAEKGAVVSRTDDAGETATLLTAMPGGAVCGVNSEEESYETYGTCVKENGVTYLSAHTLANLLDLYLT